MAGSPMVCKKCAAEMPGDHRFCGVCGSKLSTDPLDEVMLRLTDLGALVDKQMQLRDQRFLEIDTTEKIATRLMAWAKLCAFFVGIPAAATLLGLAVYAGKNFRDLHDETANVRGSIGGALEKVREDAETAKRTAADALRISNEVSRIVASAKPNASEAQGNALRRLRDGQRTNAQIRKSASAISVERMTVAQADGSARIGRQLQTTVPAVPGRPAGIAEEEVHGIPIGTARGEVIRKLGEPYMKITGEIENFTYRLASGNAAKFEFEHGKLTQLRIVPTR